MFKKILYYVIAFAIIMIVINLAIKGIANTKTVKCEVPYSTGYCKAHPEQFNK